MKPWDIKNSRHFAGEGADVLKLSDAILASNEPELVICTNCQAAIIPDAETELEFPLCECCRDLDEHEVELYGPVDPRKVDLSDDARFEDQRYRNTEARAINDWYRRCGG